MAHPLLTQDHIESFQRDGVVIIRGLFKDHVETLRAGIERNMSEPGPFASENLKTGDAGRFFDDYCNWNRIPEFEEVIFNAPAGEVAADLMRSQGVQIFHDHILVKEPGTSKPTPGTRTHHIISWKAARRSASGVHLILFVKLRFVVLQAPIFGKSRYCQLVGFPSKTSMPARGNIWRCLIRKRRAWTSGNGKWNQATRSRSTTKFCMVQEATIRLHVAELFLSDSLGMTPAMSNGRAAHLLRFRGMKCRKAKSYARTGSPSSSIVPQ